MELKLVFKILEGVWELCAEEGLAESTLRKKICYLEKILKGINEISASEIIGWVESYVSEKTRKPLDSHGKKQLYYSDKMVIKA
ncbi:MAG: hypothetical protein ACTSQP_05585 [Promethearchaeota archaeon]